jgi:hypothetical protein
MTSIVRNEFRVFNVVTFMNIFNSGNSLYLGIGRPQYWDLVANNDIAPPLPINSSLGTERDWEDIMHLKLVNPADISTGMFKEMWTPNTKYDTYRHDWNGSRASVYNGSNPYTPVPADLSQAKYYVITSNYNIYICLQQSIVAGVVQPSTQSPDTGTPVGTNTGMYKTSDGYYWKFIGITTPSDVIKFSTDTYHPVETLTVAPGINDPYYTQWLNQQNSAQFQRGIYTINVLNGGSGYNAGSAGTVSFPSANITVTGNGTGLAGTVTFGAGGSVQSIEVTNPGSGYTYMTMNIAGGSNLVLDPIYTPAWGLGADPMYDMSAYFAIINSALNSSENGVFTVTNDYRKICLIANPTNYNSSLIATTQILDATTTLVLTGGGGASGYLPDQVVTDSVTGAKGRVVDWNSTNGNLRIIRTSDENNGLAGASAAFTVGSTVQTGSGVIASIIPPTVQPYSGRVIYSEYRTPITRSLGQTENITVVVEF